MNLNNTVAGYGLVAQCLHWVTAVLVIILILLGWFMHELPHTTAAEVAYKSWFYSLHKTMGICVLALALLRVCWLVFQTHPVSLHPERRAENFVAKTVHWMLYGCIFLLPLTGWLQHSASEGFSPILWPFSQNLPMVPKSPELVILFGQIHVFAGWLLIGSVGLHIVGTIKHVIIDRDETLARMVPGRKISKAPSHYQPEVQGVLSPVLAGLVLVLVVLIPVLLVNSDRQGSFAGSTARESAGSDTNYSWSVDYAASNLQITVKQSGNEVSGSFSSWVANIVFDPENLEVSQVQVEVDVGSLTLGNVTEQALSPGILNTEKHPQAVFSSTGFIRTGEEEYEVPGLLSLSGKKMPVLLILNLRIEGSRAFAEGSAVVSRLGFGIGADTFPDENTIGDGVVLKFNVEAERST